MEFRDLKKQYLENKTAIDEAVQRVLEEGHFIGGRQVGQLEERLADYVGAKHCITCANGTDALLLALMAWNLGEGDAVFVPDFTFFSTAEVVPWVGATPVFVDVDQDTFNISGKALEEAVKAVLQEDKLIPKAVIAVDLFGQPADYPEIRRITDQYNMYLLEDGAQGFGGRIGEKMACSFGDISTTSFFPAKPLGCYGDGGAIFTDNDEWAELIKSYKVHGKGTDKYDNIRIGLNSRLDTIQAAILLAKFDQFVTYELAAVNEAAEYYTEHLKDIVKIPTVKAGFYSSWAQYTIQMDGIEERERIQRFLQQEAIPSMIYYTKPLHLQRAFQANEEQICEGMHNTADLCNRVLSLPMHPYITRNEMDLVIQCVRDYFSGRLKGGL